VWDTYAPKYRDEDPPAAVSGPERPSARMRSYHMKVGVISQAAGSAYVENGDTKVICGVYGPKQAKKGFSDTGQLWCDFKFASFGAEKRPARRGQSDEEREMSLLLSEAVSVSVMMDKFPKSVIEAYVVVLEAGASMDVMACAMSCISLAIASAGIDCYDLVCACSAASLGGQDLLDPSTDERITSESAHVLVGYMPALNQITHVSFTGCVPLEKVEQMTDLALDGCTKIHDCMRTCLLDSVAEQVLHRQTAP